MAKLKHPCEIFKQSGLESPSILKMKQTAVLSQRLFNGVAHENPSPKQLRIEEKRKKIENNEERRWTFVFSACSSLVYRCLVVSVSIKSNLK